LNPNQLAEEVNKIKTPILFGKFQEHILNVSSKEFIEKIINQDKEISYQLDQTLKARNQLNSEMITNSVFTKVQNQIEEASKIARQRNRGPQHIIQQIGNNNIQDSLETTTSTTNLDPKIQIMNEILFEEWDRLSSLNDMLNITDINNLPEPGFYTMRN